MFEWLRRKTEDLFGGTPRSPRWRRVRDEFVRSNPFCDACGRTKDLEVHHVEPFRLRPDLELDPQNLCVLCAEPCHFVHGHLLNWKKSNPHVREDAARYRKRVRDAE